MVHDILIIDDEESICRSVSGVLNDEGYETRYALNSTTALEAIKERTPQLVFLDIWLEGSRLDGLEILEILRKKQPNLPVIIISGHGNIQTAVSAIQQGAYDFIEKPFNADRLILVVQNAIEAARLKQENEELRLRAGPEEELIGESVAMTSVRQAIHRVAPTGSRVFLTGPAGGGKEVAARLIHNLSPRNSAPFLILNCAAMNPAHVEEELFGIEKGRDGQEGKPGTLEKAHGGTLLLDEVADMPLETQGKIVRVLQEQIFHRIGGKQPVSVDVRIIATSNRDLQEEIASGRFREDLFYRLNVVPIEIPPLKERREDIPELARHFMERVAQASSLPARPFAPDALAALQAYAWPGNVRQLRNMMDWLLIMAPGGAHTPIRAEMLPPEFEVEGSVSLKQEMASELMGLPLREAREKFEKEYLERQVSRFGGNVSRTAAFIGMERSALHRKLKSLGIPGNKRT